MKLCQDCVFFLADRKCGHDSAVIVDYVGGKHRRFDAQTHRVWNGAKDCGTEARHFEPKMIDITPCAIPAQIQERVVGALS